MRGRCNFGMARTIALWCFACYATSCQLVSTSWATDDLPSQDAPNLEYQVRVLSGGVELEVDGTMGCGIAEEVRRALDANPGVSVIRLNSNGGRVIEARKLRDLIVERHLSTYTVTECFSACVIAYVAGRERLMDATAKLGLHQYSALHSVDLENQHNIDRSFLLAQGVSRHFVERAFTTPNNSLWIPTQKELLEAGLVTRVREKLNQASYRP